MTAILIPQRFVDLRLVAFRLGRFTVEIVIRPPAAFLRFAFRGTFFFPFYPGHGSLLPHVQQTECRGVLGFGVSRFRGRAVKDNPETPRPRNPETQ